VHINGANRGRSETGKKACKLTTARPIGVCHSASIVGLFEGRLSDQ
jgi:hypothetical protein